MKYYSLIAALFLWSAGNAQPYTLTHFTEAYQPIADPTTEVDSQWDDPFLTALPGFSIQLAGQNFTTIYQLALGAAWGGYDVSNLAYITGFADDFISGAFIQGNAPSPIRWKTEGMAGDQIFKIEYQDAAFFSEVQPAFGTPSSINRLTFQIWFYESGGHIEYRFGPSNIPNPVLVYDNGSGPGIFIASGVNVGTGSTSYVYYLSGAPSDPVLAQEDNYFAIFSGIGLGGTPADGQVYRLTPSGTVQVNSASDALLSLYPTMAREKVYLVNIREAYPQYRIIRLGGHQVASGKSDENGIDVSFLSPGMYLINFPEIGTTLRFVKL